MSKDEGEGGRRLGVPAPAPAPAGGGGGAIQEEVGRKDLTHSEQRFQDEKHAKPKQAAKPPPPKQETRPSDQRGEEAEEACFPEP